MRGNSHSQLKQRARSQSLSNNIHIVFWKGTDYIVQRKVDNPEAWHIRRRGIIGIIKTVTERFGLGKEEAIDWLENNL